MKNHLELARDASDIISNVRFFNAVDSVYGFGQKALEMFARDGNLTLACYYDKVPWLEVWELNPEFEPALRKFKPAVVKFGCAFELMSKGTDKYDTLVIDSPQGIYPDYTGAACVEHFDVISGLTRIMADKCVVIFYINHEPYNGDEIGHSGQDSYSSFNYHSWMEYRSHFYLTDSPEKVELETALAAYRREFGRRNWGLESVIAMPCIHGSPGLPKASRVALRLIRGETR